MSNLKIFCLEAEWEKNLSDKSTVAPLYQLLESVLGIKYIHRRAATIAEFNFYIEKWARQTSYQVLVIESHAWEQGVILFPGNQKSELSLEHIKEILLPKKKSMSKRYIYFGGCEFFRDSEEELKHFVDEVGLKGAIGYTKEVGWVDSAAFSLLIFGVINERFGSKRTSSIEKEIKDSYPGLSDALGFKLIY